MKLRTPSFYKEFKCIAGKCPDSCCQGWEVDADDESLKYYKTLDKSLEIKQRIDKVLDKDEYDNTIFRPAEKMRCPFLNPENLCDMHIAIGQEHTPYTCRMFPRFINDYGALREMGIAFSCPVAADMMFNLSGDFDFCDEMNDLPPELNDIDAELYFKLTSARETAYKMMSDRTKTVAQRLSDLLDFGLTLQNEIAPYDDEKRADDTSFCDLFRNPEVINPDWMAHINSCKIGEVPNEKWCENIAMYFIYRYFLTAVYEYDEFDDEPECDILSKVKMAVIGVLATVYFGGDAWTIHLWSKETEHSDVNMQRYKELLKNAKCLSYSELKKRLLCR